MGERQSGSPGSSRAPRGAGAEATSAGSTTSGAPSTRSVVMPKSVPPPRRSDTGSRASVTSEGPKSVRAPSSTPRLPDTCAGSSGQWRPLEALNAADALNSKSPTNSKAPSIRPSTLSMPPPPSSLEALATTNLAHDTTRMPAPRFPSTVRTVAWGIALVAIGIGVGVGGGFVSRAESTPSKAPAKTSLASPAPPAAPAREVVASVPAESKPTEETEIALDDYAGLLPAERHAKEAQRRRSSKHATMSAEGVPVLPEFPDSDSAGSSTKTVKTSFGKKEQRLAEEAKDLAAKQLESLL